MKIKFLFYLHLLFSINNLYSQIEPIYFSTNSHIPIQGQDFKFNKIKNFIKLNPAYIIEIEGHADYTGNYNYNLYLSKLRACSVRDELIKRGVDSNKLSIKFYGENKIKKNKSLAANRRVDFNFIPININTNDNINIQKQIFINRDSVRIQIYDHGTIDGDIITIKMNDSLIIDTLIINQNKKEFLIYNLQKGNNLLIIEAISQGFTGAATPDIIVSDYLNEFSFKLSAYLNKPAVAIITVD